MVAEPPRNAADRDLERSPLLMQSIQVPQVQYQLYRRGGIVTIASALAILLLGLINLPAVPFLVILVLLMLLPIFYGIKVWIQVFGAGDSDAAKLVAPFVAPPSWWPFAGKMPALRITR